MYVLLIEYEVVTHIAHADLLAASKDLMTAVLLIPLGEGSSHVHLLNDVAPADARVVGAEADFTLLRGIRDDALLGAAEVIVEEVLEPHARDEEEVPAVSAALFDIGHRTVTGDLAIIAAGGAKAFVELLQQVEDTEVRRRFPRVVVAQKRERDANNRQELTAGRIVDLGHVLRQSVGVQEGGDRHSLLGFLVNHQRHTDAAVRVASAGELAPVGVWSM